MGRRVGGADPSSRITCSVRATIWSRCSGAKRKRVQRDWSAGMILLAKLQIMQKRVFFEFCSMTAGARGAQGRDAWAAGWP